MATSITPSPTESIIAFCSDDGRVNISVKEAAFLIRHFRLKGSSAQQHEELRALINSMCATMVGREGLERLIAKAHAK